NEEGKRAWVYPKKPSGKFYTYRKCVSYALLLFLITAPFGKINGDQFLLFNIVCRLLHENKFPFWPQDFYLFVLWMVIRLVYLVFFYAAFGRIFCAWICPQTIFIEMVFRRTEYWIEGDRGARIRLSIQKRDAEKIRYRVLKWII